MPELPEVECLTRAIRNIVDGGVISKAVFFRNDLRDEIPIRDFNSLVVGSRITKVDRRSKFMLIHTENGVGIFHLGMSGTILCKDTEEVERQHTHAIFKVSHNSIDQYLHYVDPRRFGWISCCETAELKGHRFFRTLGPEPLVKKNLGEYLWKKAQGRKMSTDF